MTLDFFHTIVLLSALIVPTNNAPPPTIMELESPAKFNVPPFPTEVIMFPMKEQSVKNWNTNHTHDNKRRSYLSQHNDA